MKKLQETGLIAVSAILFCWIAFYNGFPLVYSDTATYIESGFSLETPLDRPILYGLFIRAASLNGVTLWTVIFLQSLLLAWLIQETVKSLFPENNSTRITLITVGFLSACTGLSVLASELIADIFTPISVLVLFVTLYGNHSRLKLFALLFVLLVACGCHISNVLICFSLAAGVGILRLLRVRKQKTVVTQRLHVLAAMIIPALALLTMLSSISKSRHVFMMGHLVETGILHAYLDDHCATQDISLCKYRDRIPPGAETFIWNSDGDSVLILTGGWLGSKAEYSKIISETYSNGKYLKMHLAAALSGSVRQLNAIRVGEGLGRYDSATLVSQRVEKYFPGAVANYRQSRQSGDEFAESKTIDLINKICTVISLLVIIAWLAARMRKLTNYKFKSLTAIFLFAYLFNCAICANLATVANRFGARLSWTFVLLAILLMCEWIMASRQTRSISK